jgi:CBS domain-containing protein
MRISNKPLLSLTAADLMTESLVIIPQAMSLKHAAHMLGQAHISGAPVVNAEGRCAGVISSTDFVSWADKGPHAAKRSADACTCAHSPWQMVDEGAPPREEVGEYMTADPVTVPPSTSIGHLAQKMVDAHIHRLVIVDPDERPIGIVSSTDILAALARAHRTAPAKG